MDHHVAHRPKRPGWAILLLVGVLPLAPVGVTVLGSSPDAAATKTPIVRVSVQVRPSPELTVSRSGTLNCSPDSGTGVFRSRTAYRAACKALLASKAFSNAAAGRLPDVCTNVYGGPDVAMIQGTVRGKRVSVAISRTDGCQLALWSELEAVLGKATGRIG